jgi:hypothetical protein
LQHLLRPQRYPPQQHKTARLQDCSVHKDWTADCVNTRRQDCSGSQGVHGWSGNTSSQTYGPATHSLHNATTAEHATCSKQASAIQKKVQKKGCNHNAHHHSHCSNIKGATAGPAIPYTTEEHASKCRLQLHLLPSFGLCSIGAQQPKVQPLLRSLTKPATALLVLYLRHPHTHSATYTISHLHT